MTYHKINVPTQGGKMSTKFQIGEYEMAGHEIQSVVPALLVRPVAS